MSTIEMQVNYSKLNEVADAIREKTGDSKKYTIDEMPIAITNIPSRINPSGTLTVDGNGTYDVYQYAKILVN